MPWPSVSWWLPASRRCSCGGGSLGEIISGGPPKDGIHAIDAPLYEAVAAARGGLIGRSPSGSVGAGGRPSNDDLRRDLRELTRQIRSDWDLSAPGLREKWEGEQADFRPYGRSMREVLAGRDVELG